ncbi:unnamed protein product [Gongylonema pulchrum]|uniref:tRNA_int_end_N2 domain-containing protein n=1 Tax=Gongylonema pulchrum TaxID=637853 RepID=A0A183D5F2_9BILA|nr:unnamed protein product [Gongylonema pulchrum]
MESMTGCEIRRHFEYLSTGGRNVKKLTIINYDANRGTFKAIQTRNAREATMGIHRSDGHYFFVEEAVWMVEAGLASVLHRGRQLSVQQCYGLLEKFCITPARYFVYSYLKRAGYVILPHNSLETSASINSRSSGSGEESVNSREPHFPSALLDQFPSLKGSNLTITCLHKHPKVMEVFQVSEKLSEITGKSFKLDENEEIRNDPREILRPRYWPKFDKFARRVTSWSDYRSERARILRRDSPEKHHPETAKLPLDYDVYAADGSFCRSRAPSPIYRLLVVGDVNAPFPSVASLHWLSSQITKGKLLIAVTYHTSIIFYNIDHQVVSV